MPLAIEFSKFYNVIGYDISKNRIKELKQFYDRNNQFNKSILKNKKLILTSSDKQIGNSNIYIVTVPTPIDKKFKPILNF